MAKRPEVSEDSPNIDMSPMIDLVFLLLMFFFIASHIIEVPVDRKAKVPIAVSATAADAMKGFIIVNIRPDGAVTGRNPELVLAAGEEDLSRVQDYIADEVAEIKSADDTLIPKIHIRADAGTSVKRIREVVEAGAQESVNQVVFAAYNDPTQT